MPEQTDQPLLSDSELRRVINDRDVRTDDLGMNIAMAVRDCYEQARKQDKERRWIPVTENCQPERNSTAIYWHKGIDKDNPIRTGFPAVADEWRWEDHGKRATHFLKYDPPTKP